MLLSPAAIPEDICAEARRFYALFSTSRSQAMRNWAVFL
jgi:hypothetical protein